MTSLEGSINIYRLKDVFQGDPTVSPGLNWEHLRSARGIAVGWALVGNEMVFYLIECPRRSCIVRGDYHATFADVYATLGDKAVYINYRCSLQHRRHLLVSRTNWGSVQRRTLVEESAEVPNEGYAD